MTVSTNVKREEAAVVTPSSDHECVRASVCLPDGPLRRTIDLSQVSALLFDCDDTLYPQSRGVDICVRDNIDAYMRVHLSIPDDKITPLRQQLWLEHGTTLRGLQSLYGVDADHYWSYVHGTLSYETLILPNESMAHMLQSLPQDKWIFSNANSEHVEAVLERIGLPSDVFCGVVDVRAMNFHNKPSSDAFDAAIRLAGVEDRSKVLFFDDSLSNIKGALRAGIPSVLISDSITELEGVVDILPSLEQLRARLPGLWKYRPDKR